MPRRVLRGEEEEEEESLLIIMIVSFFVSFQIFFGQDSGLAGWLPFSKLAQPLAGGATWNVKRNSLQISWKFVRVLC